MTGCLRNCVGLLTVIVLTLVMSHSASANVSSRVEVNLNGQWEHKIVESLDAIPKDGGWTPFAVPGMLRGHNYQRAWFRRAFVVPQALRGKRIKIHFGAVKFNSRIYVNGKYVGGCFGGYRHFEIDVTDAILFGQENQLLVGCCDWTGVFTPGKVEFGKDSDWSRLRQIPKDKILSPVGGQVNYYGIWDDVNLIAHPAVHIKDVFIKPSVRNRELVVEYTLANESSRDADVQLRAVVKDKNRDVLDLPSHRLRISAGGTAKATLRQSWQEPRLWSHKDPHLYHLQSTLSDGDLLTTRFGFREFWIEGHEFFLNGKKIHLLATSGWPTRIPAGREEIRRYWKGFKEAGCVAFRTHTQPWREVYYDIADEVGLLMIVEGAVFNDDTSYRVFDPVFWDNYAGHLRAMVDRHQNHPSVIMWSLENEFYGSRMNDESPAKKDLMRMGGLLKQCDPTRPITYESDGDVGGVTDVIGIHYPHEYPQFTCWPTLYNSVGFLSCVLRRNPGSFGEGLLERFGITACVLELNANWIAGLDDYPTAANWRLFGAELAEAFYYYFKHEDPQ
jgi:beta-galactosidase/beta-glucuronidase